MSKSVKHLIHKLVHKYHTACRILYQTRAYRSAPVYFNDKQFDTPSEERTYWCNLLYRIAEPVLKNMSEGQLHVNMPVEVSSTWDDRNVEVAYMEAFGRLMSGLAPWLSLPDDDTVEGRQRKQLRQWALQSYRNAVDPESPDYLGWTSGGQTLVDAAYLAESFYRGYDTLWLPLDDKTKERYIKEFQGVRQYDPPYTNWLLFVSIIECFLMKVGAPYDSCRLHICLNKIEEWYVGDGWYSDGPAFTLDYYNAFVIHPMYTECLDMIRQVRGDDTYICNPEGAINRYENALKRMQRQSVVLERFVSPEATFPVLGRSVPYRLAVFQPLALLALWNKLPEELSSGQVRSVITAVMKRMFDVPENFNEKGFLTLGFMGRNPNIADFYTDTGSLYVTTQAFLPLGLPSDHTFWTSRSEKWTSKKAWEGDDFPKDHKWPINKQLLYWK